MFDACLLIWPLPHMRRCKNVNLQQQQRAVQVV